MQVKPFLSVVVSKPPAKARGFRLRPKAGLIGHLADYPLSLREKAGVRGSESPPLVNLSPLILSFSLREKEQDSCIV